jgi:hypothetical protein
VDNSIVVSLGECIQLKSGKDRIIYAGMLSDEVFSMVQRKKTSDGTCAWNLYYPKKRGEITIDGVQINVENITPSEIQLHIS